MTDTDQEIRKHAEKIARLESDMFNVADIVRGHVANQLKTLQTGVDDIRRTLGDGNVMFAQLVAKDTAQQKDIDELKAARVNRLLYLVYPIIVGVVVVAIVAWLHISTK